MPCLLCFKLCHYKLTSADCQALFRPCQIFYSPAAVKIPQRGKDKHGVDKEMAEYIAVFTAGGLIYGLLEILWRGWTHWTMLACGGACFTLMYIISASRLTAPEKLILCPAVITAVEFVTGCIVNLRLGMGVWDYSFLPFNLMGQICPQFTLIWLGLSFPGLLLCRAMKRLFSARQ